MSMKQRAVYRAMAIGAIALVVLAGCFSPAPRFRSEPEGSAADTTVDQPDVDDEVRFSTKIREEVSTEDDRTVDLEKVQQQLANRPRPTAEYGNLTPTGLNRDKVLLGVVGYLGTPYRRGGNGRRGIDCSGFTAAVYKEATEHSLPRSARGQYDVGAKVPKSELQFGDLVFFNTTGRVPSHVGIYIEDDLFAHASVTQGVTFSSLESTYYRKRFVGARRVVE
jgi:hypothetical protein